MFHKEKPVNPLDKLVSDIKIEISQTFCARVVFTILKLLYENNSRVCF